MLLPLPCFESFSISLSVFSPSILVILIPLHLLQPVQLGFDFRDWGSYCSTVCHLLTGWYFVLQLVNQHLCCLQLWTSFALRVMACMKGCLSHARLDLCYSIALVSVWDLETFKATNVLGTMLGSWWTLGSWPGHLSWWNMALCIQVSLLYCWAAIQNLVV